MEAFEIEYDIDDDSAWWVRVWLKQPPAKPRLELAPARFAVLSQPGPAMCNLYSLKTGDLFDLWSKTLKLPVVWEGRASNFEPRPEIRMTELAPVLRHVGDQAVVSMTKWGWPTPPLPDPIPGKPPLEIPPGTPKPEFDDPVIPIEDPAPAPTMPDPDDGRPYDTPPRRN